MSRQAIDLPALEKVRAAIRTMAANPPGRSALGIPMALVRELYAEIREAKLVGHTWPAIRDAIQKNCGIRIAVSTINRNFGLIDEEWSKKTGVPPLPKRGNNPNRCLGKKKKKVAAA